MTQKLITYLNQHNIRYTEYNHPPVFTVAESKKLDLNIPGLHTKNLFIKNEKSNFYLLCCPADKRVNLKALKKYLKVKELHFGSPEELKKELNVFPGSVSLFAMINSDNVHLIIDKDVWNSEEVGFHPNSNTSTLVISHSDLEKFFNSLKTKKEVINIE